jgi:lactoylglutathione lyase
MSNLVIEHVAIWTKQLEQLKEFYTKYFRGVANLKYVNEAKHFESYFISFDSGARLELMSKPGIPANANDTINLQYQGIIHLAFGVDSMKEVNEKAAEMKKDGYTILSGPRKTGDGYYEFETLDPDNNRIEVTTKFIN